MTKMQSLAKITLSLTEFQLTTLPREAASSLFGKEENSSLRPTKCQAIVSRW
jgi:hypothetical protein